MSLRQPPTGRFSGFPSNYDANSRHPHGISHKPNMFFFSLSGLGNQMKPMGWGRILAAHPVQRCPTPTESWSLPGLAAASGLRWSLSCFTVMSSWAVAESPNTTKAKNYQTTNRRPHATPLLSNSGIRSGCFAHPSAGKPFWPRPRGRWKVSQARQSNHTVFI